MAEYIEREALLQRLKFKRDTAVNLDGRKRYGLDSAISQVRKAQKADVAKVRHGHWIPSKNGINPIRCSECNMPAPFAAGENEFGDFEICRYPSSYCHECGAKMDGKGEDDGE